MDAAKYSPNTQSAWVTSKRSLHIGFFTDFFLPVVSGIAISLQLLIRALRAAGHRVTIFAPRFPGYNDTESIVWRVPSIRYMRLPEFYLGIPLTPCTTLSMSRFNPDIIHVHSPLTIGMMGYLTARIKRIPLIYTYHTSLTDYTHYLKYGGGTHLARKFARWFSTSSANLSDHVVVPSAKFKRLLGEQGVYRPLHVIPNGIDLRRFNQPETNVSYRTRLGLDPHTTLLIYTGRLDPEKQLDFLLNAFFLVASRRPNVHLVIAGDGSSRSALEAQAKSSECCKQIHFLGMIDRDRLPDLLCNGDLFIATSPSEVHPLSVIEAIAAGLPVVAIRDEVYEGMLVEGINGKYAVRDPQAFSLVIIDLVDKPDILKYYGRNSVELSQKYDIESQVNSLVELYQQSIC